MSFDINIHTLNKILERRASIMEHEGTPVMNPRTVSEHLRLISMHVHSADHSASYGDNEGAIEKLVRALALGMICLDEHLEADEEKMLQTINVDSPPEAEIPMESLLLIAKYEVYLMMSLNMGKDVAEAYMDTLSENQLQVMDQYHNAKIQAMTGPPLGLSGFINADAMENGMTPETRHVDDLGCISYKENMYRIPDPEGVHLSGIIEVIEQPNGTLIGRRIDIENAQTFDLEPINKADAEASKPISTGS